MFVLSEMDVPRLEAKAVPYETITASINYAFLELGYASTTDDQEESIKRFLEGRDVFISLPTGEGKSLCYTTLPYVFDYLKRYLTPATWLSSIAVVISPLISLMKDQVTKFANRGLKCVYLGAEQDDVQVKADMLTGNFQLVYSSPESLLCVLQWREMFRSEVYQHNLVAVIVDEAHCIQEWLVISMVR